MLCAGFEPKVRNSAPMLLQKLLEHPQDNVVIVDDINRNGMGFKMWQPPFCDARNDIHTDVAAYCGAYVMPELS